MVVRIHGVQHEKVLHKERFLIFAVVVSRVTFSELGDDFPTTMLSRDWSHFHNQIPTSKLCFLS